MLCQKSYLLYMHCVRAIDTVMVRIGTGLRRKCVNISRDGADQIYVNHMRVAGPGGGGCLKRLQPTSDSFFFTFW